MFVSSFVLWIKLLTAFFLVVVLLSLNLYLNKRVWNSFESLFIYALNPLKLDFRCFCIDDDKEDAFWSLGQV